MLLNYSVGEDSWVPCTARRSNQSILKEINAEYSLEGLMMKLVGTPIIWPPDAKNWLIGKDPDAVKEWGQEENGTTEDEMVGWHHWLDDHEFEQTLGVGDGQGSLVCCSLAQFSSVAQSGLQRLDTTEWLNWTVQVNMVKIVCFILYDFYHSKKH